MSEEFSPTHVVPPGGLAAFETAGTDRPTASLDALLPVRLADRTGDWGRIVCANGWSAWVDGRLLVAVPQPPPATGRPLTRTADQRPQLARAGEAVGRYRGAADDLAAGRIDRAAFRDRTRGLRAGVVIDGESVWLYDAEHERWVYGDGIRLSTYAATGAPRTPPESGGPDGTPNDTADGTADGPDATAGGETRVAGAPGDGDRPGGTASAKTSEKTTAADAADTPGGSGAAPTRAVGAEPATRPDGEGR
ncbi:hypothetical protein ABZ714_24090 [Streptomyces sp. NPDC006798]|uniref:hypothetical protein n=1 Tax=Streptomyces sp. NPDC006798 TaxID=3155462 RepID=UPI0034048D67